MIGNKRYKGSKDGQERKKDRDTGEKRRRETEGKVRKGDRETEITRVIKVKVRKRRQRHDRREIQRDTR